MKATGIVRRIDDLGRIVIPKEIRRSFRIKEGDPSPTLLILAEHYITQLENVAKRLV
jgi:bifunctional DNA-binding transcriptional regulator/antitoxin component of YhaV-PrlF toxin-antitoxin module